MATGKGTERPVPDTKGFTNIVCFIAQLFHNRIDGLLQATVNVSPDAFSKCVDPI